MSKMLAFFRRHGFLIFPLIVIGLALEAQFFTLHKFGKLHIPDSWIFHLLYLSGGPYVYFRKSDKLRFRELRTIWTRAYWAFFACVSIFYVVTLIGAELF